VSALPAPDHTRARTHAEHVAVAKAETVQVRAVVALLSLLAIPATWLVARRFLPPPWPLAAATLFAASPFVHWFAQQARPHAVVTAFLMLALASALALRARPGWPSALACAASAALAAGTLQNGLAALLPIAAALLLSERLAWGGRVRFGSTALAGAALGFAVFQPYLFTGEAGPAPALQPGQVLIANHVVDLNLFRGAGFARIAQAFLGYDPLVAVLAALGTIALCAAALAGRWRGRGRDALVVLSFALPYLVAFGLYGRTYQRFALPLAPIACLLAAGALYALVQLAGSRAVPRALAIAVCIAALLAQALLALGLARARSAPSTIDEAVRWVESRVERVRERVAVTPGFELPLLLTDGALDADRVVNGTVVSVWHWHLYQVPPGGFDGPRWDVRTLPLGLPAERERARADMPGFLDAQGADWLVLQVYEGWFPLLESVRAAARARGDPVARFSPYRDGNPENLPLSFQDDEMPHGVAWALEAARARCVGPVVEVYRLR
jgi:hypothetical protein